MKHPDAIVHYRGQLINCCKWVVTDTSYGRQGYAVMHLPDGEHEVIKDALEIWIGTRLMYYSPDLWHRGMMRPY